MTNKLLTIVIPVRSEEETIKDTVKLLEHMVTTPHSILIADDTVDPKDRTLEVIENMHISHLSINKKVKGNKDGFGPALARAFKTVTTPYTTVVMADSSDDPKTIDLMVKLIEKTSADVIVGCRYMKGAKKVGGPKLQGVLSTLLNSFFFYVLRFPTKDATNAFRLYRSAFLKRIIPRNPEIGVEFSLQLTIQAQAYRGRIIDMPTKWSGREKGQSKVRLMNRGPKYLRLMKEGFAVQLNRVFL